MRRAALGRLICSTNASHVLTAPLFKFAIVVSTCLTCRASLGTSDSISLPGNGSYVAYPHWTLSPGAQTTISFLTSEENGTLLFVDTDAGSVHVSLEAGSLSVRSRAAGGQRLVVPGEQLNDDSPHQLRVSLSDDARTLRLQLVDANLSLLLDSTPPTSYEPVSPLYVGGVPSNHSQSGSLVPFAGCLLGVTTSLSNGSSLLSPPVVSSEGATWDACRTPCDDITTCAHNASCAYRWGAQATTTCDCRDALLVGAGPSCSDDPALVSTVTLDGTSYHCFHLPWDTHPYHSEPERSMVQLLPGHPEIGTIMTGTSGESPSSSSSFTLYLADRRLVFSLSGPYNSTHLRSQVTLLTQCAYLVEVTIDAFFVTVAITNTTFSAMPALVDSIVAPLPQSLSALRFDDVCVGGGALEVPLYSGSLQSPYHRRYALGETRNFAPLAHERVPRSSGLSFLPGATDPPLTFYQLFSPSGLSFSFLTARPGPLLVATSNDRTLSVLIASDQLLFVSLADHGNYTSFSLELALTDGEWHTFELAKGEGEGEGGQVWTLNIDNVTCFMCPGDGCGLVLESLSCAPVHLGWKTRGFLLGNPVAFTGCMKDFRFPNNASPNLEVMARRAPSRFSVDGCPDRTIPASFVTPTPSKSFLISATSSPLPLIQSPDLSTTLITTTTTSGASLDRKRLYAAIAVSGVFVLTMVAIVCAASLHRRYTRRRQAMEDIAEHRTQTRGLPSY
eukprot:Em0007g243a